MRKLTEKEKKELQHDAYNAAVRYVKDHPNGDFYKKNNPFRKGTDLHKAWLEGFKDSQP